MTAAHSSRRTGSSPTLKVIQLPSPTTGSASPLEGIGPATARVIRELHEQGRSRYYEELRERTPAGLLEVLAVPRLGASKVRILHERLQCLP